MSKTSRKASAGRLRGRGLPPIAIVTSLYNRSITNELRDGAIEEYVARGGSLASLVLADAPGAFELASLCSAAARSGRVAGVVALGCVIKGETRHDRYIADAVAQSLAAVSVWTGVPVGFGVLTTENARQARERAGGTHGNKGREAMSAVLDAVAAIAALERGAGYTISNEEEGSPLPRNDKAASASRRAGRAKASRA